MKTFTKSVLTLAVVAAFVSFTSCGNANTTKEAVEEETIVEATAPEEDTTAVETTEEGEDAAEEATEEAAE